MKIKSSINTTNIVSILFFLLFIFLCFLLLSAVFPSNSYAANAAAEKEQITVLKKQIKLEVDELKKIEAKIHRIKAAQRAKVKNLTALYASMSPGKAASILPQINKGIAIYILSHMTPRTASAIISRMPVKDAAFFTNSIAGK